MNFIGAALLFHCHPKVAMIIISYLYEDCEMCDIFKEKLSGLHEQNRIIKNIIAYKCSDIYKHMVNQFDVSLELITTEWVLDLFSHLIPLSSYKFFLENFIKQKWKFFYKLII